MDELIHVVCVCVGDKYPHDYVHKLKSMVGRHLSLPHDFACLSDAPIEGIEYLPRSTTWPGWWAKLELFRPGFGPFVYLDLDTVIVGSIDWLAEYLGAELAVIENWGSRPREGPLYEDEISSAFMVSNGRAGEVFQRFTPAEISRLSPHGDQTWITEVMRGRFTLIPQSRIASYKRHCRDPGVPPSLASIVAFHGFPAPHEVDEPWVRLAWR